MTKMVAAAVLLAMALCGCSDGGDEPASGVAAGSDGGATRKAEASGAYVHSCATYMGSVDGGAGVANGCFRYTSSTKDGSELGKKACGSNNGLLGSYGGAQKLVDRCEEAGDFGCTCEKKRSGGESVVTFYPRAQCGMTKAQTCPTTYPSELGPGIYTDL